MRRRTSPSWWTAPPPARRSSSPKRASRKQSWCRTGLGKSAVADGICWEPPTSPRISMLRCLPKYRNISSRRRESSDPHILLWWDRQLRGLSRPLRAAIADEANDMFVSAASIWELAIKRAIGKLSFSRSIVDAVSELGFEILPVTGSHAEHAGGLPRHHNDPFDRLIIAQAHLEGMVLGTQDLLMRPYGVAMLGLD